MKAYTGPNTLLKAFQLIRQALKNAAPTDGDGIEITETEAGPKIGVTTPVRGIVTQAEFDALTEAERNKGLYVISDSGEGGGSGGETQSGTVARHMVVFEESGTFNPADYGLGAGDTVNVTVVGGGEGGFGAYNGKDGLDAGEASSDTYKGKSGYGYGAGGGGGNSSSSGSSGGKGGNGGEILSTTVQLQTAEEIPITVGAAGSKGPSTTQKPTPGGASSFGAYATALGGKTAPETGTWRGGTYGSSGENHYDGSRGLGPLGGDGGRSAQYAGGGGGGGSGYLPDHSGLESGPITMVQKGSGVVIVEWFSIG